MRPNKRLIAKEDGLEQQRRLGRSPEQAEATWRMMQAAVREGRRRRRRKRI